MALSVEQARHTENVFHIALMNTLTERGQSYMIAVGKQ